MKSAGMKPFPGRDACVSASQGTLRSFLEEYGSPLLLSLFLILSFSSGGWRSGLEDLEPATSLLENWREIAGMPYSIGVPLFWLPWYLAGKHLTSFLPLNAWLMLPLASLFYGITGLLIMWNFLRGEYGKRIATIAVWGVLLGTRLPHYIAERGAFPQAVDLFVLSLFIVFWLRIRGSEATRSRWFFLGWLGGIVGMVQTRDLLFALMPLFDMGFFARLSWREKRRNFFTYGSGLFFGFLPQAITFRILSGQWFHPGELALFQSHPVVWDAFLGPHGVFLSAPIVLLALVGGFLLLVRLRRVGFLLLLPLFLELLFLPFSLLWWEGERFLLNGAPLYMIWIAEFLYRLGWRKGTFLTGLLSLIGFIHCFDWGHAGMSEIVFVGYADFLETFRERLAHLPADLVERFLPSPFDHGNVLLTTTLLLVLLHLFDRLIRSWQRDGLPSSLLHLNEKWSRRLPRFLPCVLLLLLVSEVSLRAYVWYERREADRSPNYVCAMVYSEETGLGPRRIYTGTYGKIDAFLQERRRKKIEYYEKIVHRLYAFQRRYFVHDLETFDAHSTKLFELTPRDAKIFCERGDEFARRNAFDKAVTDWQQVLRIKPLHAGARKALISFYLSTGEKAEANRYNTYEDVPSWVRLNFGSRLGEETYMFDDAQLARLRPSLCQGPDPRRHDPIVEGQPSFQLQSYE
ncbi:MAG: hypothetical protein D6795_01405 [Deltaproteobacteria bacterium]|nr:MAG: hypothetical protein D6795_01405 [Deltaproteobacteria bacterium]